jgi:exodeoxyribonuclease X
LTALAQDRDADIRFSAETELRRRGAAGAPMAAEPAQKTLF